MFDCPARINTFTVFGKSAAESLVGGRNRTIARAKMAIRRQVAKDLAENCVLMLLSRI
jgi:hypothetical protein